MIKINFLRPAFHVKPFYAVNALDSYMCNILDGFNICLSLLITTEQNMTSLFRELGLLHLIQRIYVFSEGRSSRGTISPF